MGKRSSFERIEKDFYPTPREAVLPLLYHITPCTFWEPCRGGDHLVSTLENFGFRAYGLSDSELDARTTDYGTGFDCFVTNPPWTREILHPIITNLRLQAPTWLLFDADWMHTRQASEHLRYCEKIISVGRVRWIPDSKNTGKDNSAWYLFQKERQETRFIGR